MDLDRRFFIGGLATAGAYYGFAAPAGKFLGSGARLVFGVVSDVHIRKFLGRDVPDVYRAKRWTNERDRKRVVWEWDELAFVHALEYYRDQGVDAVVVAGDLADDGLFPQMQLAMDAWRRVFPNDRRPDGGKIERIFVTGNHEFEGWKYRKKTLVSAYPSEADLVKDTLMSDPQRIWSAAYGEEWQSVFRREVKGYTFVGANWDAGGCGGRAERFNDKVVDFYAAARAKLDPKLPFFHIQHPHPRDTVYGDWAWGRDDGTCAKALAGLPNAIVFSGHSHYTLTDPRAIWQGGFTSIGTGSLRDCGSYYFRENTWMDRVKPQLMQRYNTEGTAQGLLVSVYDDRIVVGRRDFVQDKSLGPDWIVPLDEVEKRGGQRTYSFGSRAKVAVPPEFPAGAKVTVTRQKLVCMPDCKTNADQLHVTFPRAVQTATSRLLDYEVAADLIAYGTVQRQLVKRIVAAGYNEPLPLRKDLPDDFCIVMPEEVPITSRGEGWVRFSVTPLDAWGNAGKPIYSDNLKINPPVSEPRKKS